MVRMGGLEPPCLRTRPSNVRVYQFHHIRRISNLVHEFHIFVKDSSMKNYYYILALGSNLGNREMNLKKSMKILNNFIYISHSTPLQETHPFQDCHYDGIVHSSYFNLFCLGEGQYSPEILYKEVIVPIEDQIGHSRIKKYLPRKIDIDIVQCFDKDKNEMTLINDNFHVPHQSFLQRELWIENAKKLKGFLK